MRYGINARYNETIIAIEKQKAKFLKEAVKNRQPENEDSLLFRSLKLRFRNRIQHVVDEFVYPPVSSTFQHCPFSLSSPPSASSTF